MNRSRLAALLWLLCLSIPAGFCAEAPSLYGIHDAVPLPSEYLNHITNGGAGGWVTATIAVGSKDPDIQRRRFEFPVSANELVETFLSRGTLAAGLPDFETGLWFGLMAPTGTPKEAIAKLNRIANEALQVPEVAKALQPLGIELVGGSVEEFSRYLDGERQRWASVVQAAGLRQ